MLADFAPSATIAVKELGALRAFYEDTLGFRPIGAAMRGAQTFLVRHGTVVIYESPFAGTNQATSVTWTLGKEFDVMVEALGAKGVLFEHYQMTGIVLEGPRGAGRQPESYCVVQGPGRESA